LRWVSRRRRRQDVSSIIIKTYYNIIIRDLKDAIVLSEEKHQALLV